MDQLLPGMMGSMISTSHHEGGGKLATGGTRRKKVEIEMKSLKQTWGPLIR